MFKKTREKSPYFHVAVDFGYTLLAGVGVYGGLGYWLDSRYKTTPLLLIAGILLGLAAAFNSLIRKLNLLDKRQKEEKNRRHP